MIVGYKMLQLRELLCMYVYVSFGWSVPRGSLIGIPGTVAGLFNSRGLGHMYSGHPITSQPWH